MYFDNSNFVKYIRLLNQLHLLIRDGKDELPEGDALRDSMDEPGSRLSREEVESANGISADLYSLVDAPQPTLPQTPEVRTELRRAIAARDADEMHTALAVVRHYGNYVAPSVLSYIRGTIWTRLGEHAIALQFYQNAALIEPTNANYAYLTLNEYEKFDYHRALELSEKIISEPNEHHAKVVLKALEIVFYSTREQIDADLLSQRGLLATAFDETIFRLQSTGEDGNFLAMAFTLAGICNESLDNFSHALDYYNRGIAIAPNNEALLIARGILLYGHDNTQSLLDFKTSVNNNSKLIWPYFFLAHNSLIRDDFENCLGYCGHCERINSSQSILANIFEWSAICHASLGSAQGLIEAYFQSAVRLAPDNARILRNFKLYKESLDNAPSTLPIRWNMDEDRLIRKTAEIDFRPRLVAA